MADTITQEPVSFPSTDAETTIHGYIWRDEGCASPRGIIQIAHGMAEHIERYDDFARFLASKGFIVGGYDHLAHGESVSQSTSWGELDPRNGANHLIEDVHRMRSYMLAHTPAGLPYFVFGHSMGSYIMRDYIARQGDGLAGAILCGTGYVAPIVSKAGNMLSRVIAAIRGKGYESKLLDSMAAGGFNRVIDDPLTREACDPKTFRAIPQSLPLLFIAGAEDPVGSMGKGVRKVAAMAREAGIRDVEVRIYEGMRHEILNERDAQAVYDDVLTWLDGHLSGGAQ